MPLYKKALWLIKTNLEIHDRMAKALLERETLNSNDIDEIMAGVG
jgi:ATP-dependent Zn protease